MEYKTPDSCTSQELGEQKEVSSPLVGHDLRAELTPAQTSSITEEQYAELEKRLKAAIAKEAHERFASPSFPPELRLQVMKAAVLQNIPTWQAGRYTSLHSMRHAAFSSLLPSELWNSKKLRFNSSWLDSKARGTLANTAKQALLETAIFKANATFMLTNEGPRFDVPPLLEEVGARIHYLDLSVRVDLMNLSIQRKTDEVSAATQRMTSLKRHFPNLKTCVLTLDVHFRVTGANGLTGHGTAFPTIPMFDRQLLQSTYLPRPSHNFRTLGDDFAKLFEVFADEGPGKSRFVRIRSRSTPSPDYLFGGQIEEHLECFTYGPLVRAERVEREDVSLGARLVDAAYRLERTGPPLLSYEMLGP